jgi:hypothetical protein
MQSALNIDTHQANERPTMLVQLDGPTLRNPDGTVLAELHQGCWRTPDGLPCTALEVPAVKARPRVPAAAREAARHERDEAWMSCALAAIRQLAQQQATLTSDDVWGAIPMPPRQSRMIGNALARAQRAGVIEKTEEHRPSVRRENHSRPVRVWRSRLCGQLTR